MIKFLLPVFIYLLFLVSFAYFFVMTFYFLLLSAISFFEEKRRVMELDAEDFTTLYSSSFTLPVSVIIPAHNEEEWITDAVKAALNLKYPEFEVIVVDDGSTDNTLKQLDSLLKLKPFDMPFAEYLRCGRIREIFKSQAYPNVTVINKDGGCKKAGAVNAALNISRFKYVCVTDADTIIEPDALIKVMAHVQKDPENIIGVGAYFGLVNGLKIKDGKIIKWSFSHKPTVASQNIEYMRSLIVMRTAWSKFNVMPIIAGGFGIWRRDIFLELGGYSPEYSSEDLEFTFRVHDYFLEKNDKKYKVLMLPYIASWTEGPSNIVSLIRQRNRWQRVTNETVWHYKHMIFNLRYGAFAFFLLPYFLFYEVFGVFIEVAAIAFLVWGITVQVVDMRVLLAFFSFMVLTNTISSLLAIFIFTKDQKVFSMKDITYFIVLSFLEFFWYRWIITIAKIMGTFSWLRGIKTYDQYVRAER